MFERLRIALRDWKKAREIERHPVLSQVLGNAKQTLYGTSTGLGKHMPHEQKARYIASVTDQVAETLQQPNPARALRRELANQVADSARYAVLLTETKQITIGQQLPTGHGYSGELTNHLVEIANTDAALRLLIIEAGENSPNAAVIRDIVAYHFWRCRFVQEAFQLADIHVNKWHQKAKTIGQNWIEPLFISKCIASEAFYRKKIGLPSVLGVEHKLKERLHYDHWDTVIENAEDPLAAWNSEWESKTSEPSPYRLVPAES